MIYKPPVKFDSTEYIFIGKIISYTGSLYSDSISRSFQGLIVEIVESVYLPKKTSGFIKIVPYVLGSACDLTTWDRKSFEQQYPLGTELRIVGRESVFIKNVNPSDNIILDINPRNMFTLSKNFKEPAILFSTKSSIYDYNYACEDSFKNFRNLASLYSTTDKEILPSSFWHQFHFELRKDLYRLSVADSDSAKKEIINRLFAFRSYQKKDFLEIINNNIADNTIKEELKLLMPKRFEYPPADITLHPEIPASLSSRWIQTNGPYGGPIFCFTLKENSDKSLVLYAGTRTNGVFRSTNTGKSWSAVNEGLTNPHIYTLCINDSIIYAGTDSGAFRSSDDGDNWIAINNGFEIKKVFRVYAFASSDQYLFAGSNGRGVFRSSDNGENWSAINSGITNLQVNCLLHYEKYLFAGTYGGIFVSTNEGDNWRAINEGLPNRLYPNTKSVWLYINTILMSGENLFIGTEEDGMYYSTDFGEKWINVNLDLKDIRIHSIKGNPSNLFASTRNGIYRSTNNGEDWTVLNKTFSRFNRTSIAVFDSILYTGNFGIQYTSDHGEHWSNINEGLNNTSISDLCVTENNLIARVHAESIFLLTDNGFKWSSICDDLPFNEFKTIASNDRNIFIGTPDGIYLSSNSGSEWTNILEHKDIRRIFLTGNNLFVSVKNNLIKTTDLGKSWDTCLTWINVKSIEKSENFLFLVSSGKQGILRSSDNGLNWKTLDIGEDCRISSLASKEDNLYAMGGKCGVMMSSNGGDSWVAYDNDFKYYGLRNLTVYNEYLFAATDHLGVFISTNNGQDWIPFNFGLTDLRILSLVIKDNILFAGTTSGVWAHKLYNDN